ERETAWSRADGGTVNSAPVRLRAAADEISRWTPGVVRCLDGALLGLVRFSKDGPGGADLAPRGAILRGGEAGQSQSRRGGHGTDAPSIVVGRAWVVPRVPRLRHWHGQFCRHTRFCGTQLLHPRFHGDGVSGRGLFRGCVLPGHMVSRPIVRDTRRSEKG